MSLLKIIFIIIFAYEAIEDFKSKEIYLFIHIINILLSLFIWNNFIFYFIILLIYYLLYKLINIHKYIGIGDILYLYIYFYYNMYFTWFIKFYILFFIIIMEYLCFIYLKKMNNTSTLPLIPVLFIGFLIVNYIKVV